MSLNRASESIKYIVDNQVANKIQADLDAYVFAATGADWTVLMRALSNLNILKSRIRDVISSVDKELVTAPAQVATP